MGNINVYGKIMIEKQKKIEILEIKEVLHKLRVIDGSGMEFTAC